MSLIQNIKKKFVQNIKPAAKTLNLIYIFTNQLTMSRDERIKQLQKCNLNSKKGKINDLCINQKFKFLIFKT